MEYSKPYFKVVFKSLLEEETKEYKETSQRMMVLAAQQEGFLGVESSREESGQGVTTSYWKTLEAIKAWKAHPEHKEAQEKGQTLWYKNYSLEILPIK